MAGLRDWCDCKLLHLQFCNFKFGCHNTMHVSFFGVQVKCVYNNSTQYYQLCDFGNLLAISWDSVCKQLKQKIKTEMYQPAANKNWFGNQKCVVFMLMTWGTESMQRRVWKNFVSQQFTIQARQDTIIQPCNEQTAEIEYTSDKLKLKFTAVSTKKSTQGRKQAKKQSPATQIAKMKEIMAIGSKICAAKISQSWNYALPLYLAKTGAGKDALRLALSLLGNTEQSSMVKLLRPPVLSTAAQIYLQNEAHISDARRNILRQGHSVQYFMTSPSTLYRYRREVIKPQVRALFKIHTTAAVANMSPKVVLEQIVSKDVLTNSVPTKYIIKVGHDASPTQVLTAIAIPNEQRLMQDPKQMIPIAAWPKQLGETQEAVVSNSDISVSELATLAVQQSIQVNDSNIPLQVVSVADLKAAWALYGLNGNHRCPYCDGTVKQCIAGNVRNLKDVYGISTTQFCICALHAFNRVILNSAYATYCAFPNILPLIQALPGLREFRFDGKTCNDSDLIFEKMPFINKAQGKTILLNMNRLLKSLPNTLLYQSLWNAIFHVCNYYLLCHTSDIHTSQKSVREQWMRHLLYLWNVRLHQPIYDYLHILYVHGEELLGRFGSLAQYSNEGLEAFHQVCNEVGRKWNKNGSKSPISQASHLLHHFACRLFLDVELRKKNRQSDIIMLQQICKNKQQHTEQVKKKTLRVRNDFVRKMNQLELPALPNTAQANTNVNPTVLLANDTASQNQSSQVASVSHTQSDVVDAMDEDEQQAYLESIMDLE